MNLFLVITVQPCEQPLLVYFSYLNKLNCLIGFYCSVSMHFPQVILSLSLRALLSITPLQKGSFSLSSSLPCPTDSSPPLAFVIIHLSTPLAALAVKSRISAGGSGPNHHQTVPTCCSHLQNPKEEFLLCFCFFGPLQEVSHGKSI